MVDFFAAAQRVISMIMTGSEISIIVWLVSGGIIYVLRGISFWIDTLLVNFIGSIYNYFMMLLNGTMFNKEVTNQLLTNVYVFIGIVVFFRLAMLIIKYLMNPEMISDEKAGVNSLIKRVIIGMCGIIVIPLIFEKATELQAAIIDDQIIQQIIIPSDMIEATSEKASEGGQFIGTYVFAGFINPSSKASDNIKREFTVALEKGDLSSIDFNSGGFLGIGYTDYDYSYFYLVSTFVLAYVLYLMIKYCLDIVVRFFKLLLYQLMAPIAMVEYMINGSENGVFKNWKSAVLSTYFMLFVRVLAIWFVVFVMTLMSGEYSVYSDKTLLVENDYLLRALIIIGLLGFMMDLPKLVGNIFGLDLEQESSATGVLKSIGGIVKGVGMGALAAGGAAIGGAAGALGGLQKAGLGNVGQRRAAIKNLMNDGMTKKEAKKALSGTLHAQNASALSSAFSSAKSAGLATLSGVAGAAIGSTMIGKGIQDGYKSVSSEMSKDRSKAKEEAKERRLEDRHSESMKYNESKELRDIVSSQVANNPTASKSDIVNSVLDTQINAKLNGVDIGAFTADINGRIATISTTNAPIEPSDVVQNVQQVLSSKLGVSPSETTQIVNQVMGNSGTATVEQIDQVVNQVVQTSKNKMTQEVTQTVNQVMGNVVSNTVSSATQTVNQQASPDSNLQNPTSIDQTVNLQYDEPEKLMDDSGQNRIRRDNDSIDYNNIVDQQFDRNQDG